MTNPPLPNTPFGKTNAKELSWWAEEADGEEGEELCIVADKTGNADLLKQSEISDETRLLVIARNGDARREKPQIGFSLDLINFHGIPKHMGAHPDAFFVTASAARKFVYPYYESHRLLTDQELDILKKTPFGEEVVGIAHYPPSRPRKVDRQGDTHDAFPPALVILAQPKGKPAMTEIPKPLELKAYAQILLKRER